MPLKVKVINPLGTVPTIANEGDLAYDVYSLRTQGQPVNHDGTPIPFAPPAAGIPYRIDMNGKNVQPIRIEADAVAALPTGLTVEFTKEEGKKYGLQVEPRSSLALKGLTIRGGQIDSGYRGELMILISLTKGSYIDIWPGDKIAQIRPVEVLADTVEVVEVLEDTARGSKGFGSSGQ